MGGGNEHGSLIAALRRSAAQRLDPGAYRALHDWQQDAERYLVELGAAQAALRDSGDLVALHDVAEATRAWVACSLQQMRQERGKGHCPHTIPNGGDQPESCFKLTLDALMHLDDVRAAG